jgi:hypothetical protein
LKYTDLKNDKNAVLKIYTRIGELVSIIKPDGKYFLLLKK